MLKQLNSTRSWVGIDTGTRTGYAYAKDGILIGVTTLTILEALRRVESLITSQNNITILVEDPRTIGGKLCKAQGAGSVKRDAGIWGEFADECKKKNLEHVTFRFLKPRNTKVDSIMFRKITGWQGRTSHHARDAAMMIWPFLTGGVDE